MTVDSSPSVLLACEASAIVHAMVSDLQQAGYCVFLASTLQEVLNQYRAKAPVLGVIDSSLSEGGLRCCERLRSVGASLPILMLMNQERVSDRVACLEAGADDYILKPYQRDVFLQRIRLYLQPQSVPAANHLEFEDLSLNLTTRTAVRGTQTIELTMKEFELLKYLMEHPSDVLTREQILENVWGYDYLGESNVIEVYIRYLRIKLEKQGGKRLIHTVRGIGYVLRTA
ncbi:response regulator transcription factor NblR [Lyngbya confervoides]|uniref:Response regulator transcription factor n=1 Tax=Lyngbya confervoides BDU141951 TaxID=1574623 RepID=A0ABD4TAD6_9CYAN|nr:response regulator transcription factor [Lyngbya confervoides]MCM1985190.1 response regulator transcription factor [Lyngbya confervoides BDU141951]